MFEAQKRNANVAEQKYVRAKKRNTNTDVIGWGEDRRVGVCSSNCGHWKTIIGYMETSQVVAKCSNVKKKFI